MPFYKVMNHDDCLRTAIWFLSDPKSLVWLHNFVNLMQAQNDTVRDECIWMAENNTWLEQTIEVLCNDAKQAQNDLKKALAQLKKPMKNSARQKSGNTQEAQAQDPQEEDPEPQPSTSSGSGTKWSSAPLEYKGRLTRKRLRDILQAEAESQSLTEELDSA